MLKKHLHWLILGSLALAVILGMICRATFDGESMSGLIDFCEFLGAIFLKALKMVIVPLVASSVIAGIISVGKIEGFARLGLKTLFGYGLTSCFAIVVGLTMVNVMQPGKTNGEPNEAIAKVFESNTVNERVQQMSANTEKVDQSPYDKFKELSNRMVSSNIIQSATENGNLLAVIFFSILFAIAAVQLPDAQQGSLGLTFEAIQNTMVKITEWVMMLAPVGVFGLMFPKIFTNGLEGVVQLWKYFLTVVMALAAHLFVVMPLLMIFAGKINPLKQFAALKLPLLTAFSTASSAATLPQTLESIRTKVGVSKRVSSFTIPLGATVNMDGTALYECVAVMFVAQVMGVELTLAQQIGVAITALLTSVGVAGVPSASMVAILMILKSSGIAGAEQAIVALLAVDRLLDMSRTAVNVFGDASVATIIAKSEGEEVKTAQ